MPATRRSLDDACAAVAEVATVYQASIRPLCVVREEEGEADEGDVEGEGSGRRPRAGEEEGEEALQQAAARIEQLLAEAKTIITATTVVQKFVTAPPPPAS